MKTVERVHFRLLMMPCCNFMACWVNPRLPTYCPECGSRVFPEVKSCVTLEDTNAVLTVTGEMKELNLGR